MTEEQKRQILDILMEAVCVVTDLALAERMKQQIKNIEADLAEADILTEGQEEMSASMSLLKNLLD